jgi:dethiobiotin synthetase
MQHSRSSARLIVAGTGTGVGKTHVACALLRHLVARGTPFVGLKPIETGLGAGVTSDQCRLLRAALGMPVSGELPAGFHVKQPAPEPDPGSDTFHVKPSAYWFGPAVGPHLAAREAGQRIDLGLIRAWVLEAEQRLGAAALVETPGGLFTPLGPGTTNLDLALALEPAIVLLVAPDRLGVLHEVNAALGLAEARGRSIDAVVLSAPDRPDGSTGRNAAELEALGITGFSLVFPRTSEISPATEEQAIRLAAFIDRRVTQRAGPDPT